MKINIINHKIQNNIYIQTGKTEKQSLQTYPADTITFSSKIPSIVTPTMEDLINRTKAADILRFNILRLAKFKIPCPVCGHIMLDVENFNKFENKVMATTNPGELLDCVEELKEYLHPVEAKMYKFMRSMHYEHPKMTIHEMLKRKLPISEKRIIQEQSRIFSNLVNISNRLPGMKTKLNVQELINETYARILDPRETSRFSRKIFLDKLKKALGIMPKLIKTENGEIIEKSVRYTPLQQEIMEEAVKLPMAYNNEDAFIVKYAKRNYNKANADQKIILRMLSNSLATIEHIKAQKLNGDTAPPNLALECACCNNRKNHNTLLEQILENPRMIFNYPRYMRRLCEIHLMGKVEKSYITQQNKTFKDGSYGLLDDKLSLIRYPYSRRGKYTVRSSSSRANIEDKKKETVAKMTKKHAKKIKRSKQEKHKDLGRRK